MIRLKYFYHYSRDTITIVCSNALFGFQIKFGNKVRIPGIKISVGFICKDDGGLITKRPSKSDTPDGIYGFLQHINKKYYITISQHSPI